MKEIIFIWWAPWTWKTSLAKHISKKKQICYISADFIREWMKLVSTKDKFKNLFVFPSTAEIHYKKYSIEETIKMEQKRDNDVIKWVIYFIKKNKFWESYIIEWITIHPKYVEKLKELFNIKMVFIFLVDLNKSRIKDIIFTRGLWWKEKRVKKLEVEYVLKTNKYYLEELKKYNYKYYLIDKNRNKTIYDIEKDLNIK